ncbi:hypothetical protein [Arthrobacter mobilis]|uniref:Uncharacterized protein n=1 Tax=Arthrobacter mobilis TaxID=2724944 RepID=A0A7X6K7Z1_9MICC|nr:hypothetical protein [Arthrobacter mobilis]NKX56829.1 hypothetical protein [Arthrobacter mobilis]
MKPSRILAGVGELRTLEPYSLVCPPTPLVHPPEAERRGWLEPGSNAVIPAEQTFERLARNGKILFHWDARPTGQGKAWQTIIPGRKPLKKAHVTLTHAKSAITGRIWRVADVEMQILELDPATGEFTVLYDIPTGTTVPRLPWKQGAR